MNKKRTTILMLAMILSSIVTTHCMYAQGFLPGKLCETPDGLMHGFTMLGGFYDKGILFSWNPSTNKIEKKLDFNGPINGSKPSGSLILAKNGRLYGITEYGGDYDEGVLFEWIPVTNTFRTKASFNGSVSGRFPYQSYLCEADNGNFYGVTRMGGMFDKGVIFEWNPITNNLSKVLDFDGIENGENPYGWLIQAHNGLLYGMTNMGGSQKKGIIFEFDPESKTLNKKIDFTEETGGHPIGSLNLAENGNLYGTTTEALNGSVCGVVFEWNPDNNIFKSIYRFSYDDGVSNGCTPLSSVVLVDNKLYGITKHGGQHASGVLFEINLNDTAYNVKFHFNYNENGIGPNYLTKGSDGKVYFTTESGLQSQTGEVIEPGAIFEFDPTTGNTVKKYGFIKNDINESVSDIEGNVYRTVKIGNQTWMAENLRTTKYNNGVSLSNIKDNFEWGTTGTGAYCYYLNNAVYKDIFGAYYNLYAIRNNNNLCPAGWRLPSLAELKSLPCTDEVNPCPEIKDLSWNGTNSTGFSAVQSGVRQGRQEPDIYEITEPLGEFKRIGSFYWSVDDSFYFLNANTYVAWTEWDFYPSANDGYSVRCVKNIDEHANVAFHKSVTQSSTQYGGNAERAVDGNTDGIWSHGSVTHTLKQLNAWWEVDLGGIYNLTAIEIWNRADPCCMERLSNYYVLVSNEPFQSKELSVSLNQPGVWSIHKNTYPAPAEIISLGIKARYIRIQSSVNSELSLAEVKVSGSLFNPDPVPTNVALYKNAKQSSTQYRGTADRAVDGNTSGKWADGSVTHTAQDLNAWWEVDLGSVFLINSVNVWNRTDYCCKERLSNFILFMSIAPFNSFNPDDLLLDDNVYQMPFDGFPDPSVTFSTDYPARYIRIQSRGTTELNIAEVIVMGSIAPSETDFNVAYNKPVTQSSIRYGGIPEKAVDGNTNGYWAGGSVTHTYADPNAWWEVDLGGIYEIDSIFLWNRTDPCCRERLSDFYLFVSDDPFVSKDPNITISQQANLWTAVVQGFSDQVYPFHLNRTGRYVRIQSQYTTELNLAEVVVRGRPNLNTYKSTNPEIPGEKPDFSFHLYPIPFDERISLEGEIPIQLIEMLNIMGQVVFKQHYETSTVDINTEMIPAGIYLIKITTIEGELIIKKALKRPGL